jgi:hypothetical protein
MDILQLRKAYHQRICDKIIRIKRDKKKNAVYHNFADCGNQSSVKIAKGITEALNYQPNIESISEQTAGGDFEKATCEFLKSSFDLLKHLRPGNWQYSTTQTAISTFSQYEHLAYLEKIISLDRKLAASLGGDYMVKPDIIIARYPVEYKDINDKSVVITQSDSIACLTPFIQENNKDKLILHASISCKWTIRSDRSQNTRTEALNLIRNRKGNLPHIVAVTAEPLPSRIASLALGTGDIDCVYHFALNELIKTITDMHNQDLLEPLMSMVDGKRLRDISDLPFDLAV